MQTLDPLPHLLLRVISARRSPRCPDGDGCDRVDVVRGSTSPPGLLDAPDRDLGVPPRRQQHVANEHQVLVTTIPERPSSMKCGTGDALVTDRSGTTRCSSSATMRCTTEVLRYLDGPPGRVRPDGEDCKWAGIDRGTHVSNSVMSVFFLVDLTFVDDDTSM